MSRILHFMIQYMCICLSSILLEADAIPLEHKQKSTTHYWVLTISTVTFPPILLEDLLSLLTPGWSGRANFGYSVAYSPARRIPCFLLFTHFYFSRSGIRTRDSSMPITCLCSILEADAIPLEHKQKSTTHYWVLTISTVTFNEHSRHQSGCGPEQETI